MAQQIEEQQEGNKTEKNWNHNKGSDYSKNTKIVQ